MRLIVPSAASSMPLLAGLFFQDEFFKFAPVRTSVAVHRQPPAPRKPTPLTVFFK
jgi:hypothetical protein